MDPNTDSVLKFNNKLSRFRDIPIRFTFATLVESNRFWIAYMIGLPALALTAALFHPVFVPVAAGIPVVICLLLFILSLEFISTSLTIDARNLVVTKLKSHRRSSRSPIDTDIIKYISIIQMGQNSLVKFNYKDTTFSKPSAIAIDTKDIPDLKNQFEQIGVPVQIHKFASQSLLTNTIETRIIITPIAIIGSITIVWQVFGANAFLTDAVAVPLITLIGLIIYHFCQYCIRWFRPDQNCYSSP